MQFLFPKTEILAQLKGFHQYNWGAFYEATLTQYIMHFTVWQSSRGGVKPQNIPGAQSRCLSYDQDHKGFCIWGRNVEATYPFLLFLGFSESATASLLCRNQKGHRHSFRPSQIMGGMSSFPASEDFAAQKVTSSFPHPQNRPRPLGRLLDSVMQTAANSVFRRVYNRIMITQS